MIKNLWWITPFLSFLVGYQLLNIMTSVAELPAPNIVGLPLVDAVKQLSDRSLNARVMMEKEEPDLVEGTVLAQTPHAFHKVKPQQSIFLIIAKKPKKLAPNILNKSTSEIETIAEQSNIRIKTYPVSSHYPVGTCIGQEPTAEQWIDQNKMIAYVSSGNSKPHIFPNIKGMPVRQVVQWLKDYPAQVTIAHQTAVDADHQCIECLVIDQKPLPGTIIEIDKSFMVQIET